MAVNTLMQMRRGTAAAWTAANPVLAAGEWGLETDTKKLKMGDGSTAWSSLAYLDALPTQSGNGGKYLTTDGSTASWASVTTDPTQDIFMMMGA